MSTALLAELKRRRVFRALVAYAIVAFAVLHALLGDNDRAFALLDKAYAERDWTLRDLKVSPFWDSLCSDPRFPRLLKQVNLD